MDVVGRLSQRSRAVLAQAEEEAAMVKREYVGTEQILLGLVGEREGMASKVLASFGVTTEAIRRVNETITAHVEAPASEGSPFNPRAERVLEQSVRDGMELGRNIVDPEDMLLGVIRVGESVATEILIQLGADPHQIRMQLIKELSARRRNGEPPA